MQRTYSPLRMFPALFRTFSDVPVNDREAILAFANNYGRLGLSDAFFNVPHPTEPGRQVSAAAETHRDWAGAIDALKDAVRLWDRLNQDDGRGLEKYIRWNPGEVEPDGRPKVIPNWGFDSHPELPRDQVPFPSRRFVALPREDLERMELPNDIRAAAQLIIQKWINAQLDGNAAPRLLYHTDRGKMVLQIVPSSLLAGMWLQFAQAVAANKVYRSCRECGNWFEVPLTDGRSERRVFCSDPCKSKDYRRRLPKHDTNTPSRSSRTRRKRSKGESR